MWTLIEDMDLRNRIYNEICERSRASIKGIKAIMLCFYGFLVIMLLLPSIMGMISEGKISLDYITSMIVPILFFGVFFGVIIFFAQKGVENTIEMWRTCPMYYVKGYIAERKRIRRHKKSDKIWYNIVVEDVMYECKDIITNSYHSFKGRPCVIIASGTEAIDNLDRYHSGCYCITIDDLFVNDFIQG